MTLQQLRYAVAIAKCGSMSRTARQLYVSQPSLSAAIKELETELGITIFERTGRGIRLSSDGADFIRGAVSLLEQADDLKARFGAYSPEAARSFSVSAQHYSFVADAFVEIMRRMPESRYNLTLREGRTLEIIEDVCERKSEIGVLFLSTSNRRPLTRLFASRGLDFSAVKQVEPHVFIRPGHPLSGRDRLSPRDLQDYPYICYEQGEVSPVFFSEELMVEQHSPQVIYVSDRATMENVIAQTDTYTIGTGYIIPTFTGVGMSSIPLDTDEQMEIGIITLREAGLSSLARDFVKVLTDSLYRWSK